MLVIAANAAIPRGLTVLREAERSLARPAAERLIFVAPSVRAQSARPWRCNTQPPPMAPPEANVSRRATVLDSARLPSGQPIGRSVPARQRPLQLLRSMLGPASVSASTVKRSSILVHAREGVVSGTARLGARSARVPHRPSRQVPLGAHIRERDSLARLQAKRGGRVSEHCSGRYGASIAVVTARRRPVEKAASARFHAQRDILQRLARIQTTRASVALAEELAGEVRDPALGLFLSPRAASGSVSGVRRRKHREATRIRAAVETSRQCSGLLSPGARYARKTPFAGRHLPRLRAVPMTGKRVTSNEGRLEAALCARSPCLASSA